MNVDYVTKLLPVGQCQCVAGLTMCASRVTLP